MCLDYCPYFVHLNHADLNGQNHIGEDDMKSKQQITTVSKLLILFVSIMLLFACSGRPLSYRGSWVEEHDRINLQAGGPHQGNWQTRDLSIQYEYQKEAQNILISGVVNLADYLKIMGTLDHLTLEIQLLETNGIVQDTKGIRTFGTRRSIDSFGKMFFNRSLNLSEDTVAVAFSYDGKITQGGGGAIKSSSGEKAEWDFWKVPRRKPVE
jgi:hypothetical protein